MQSATSGTASFSFQVVCDVSTNSVIGALEYSDSASGIAIDGITNDQPFIDEPPVFVGPSVCDNDRTEGHYLGTFGSGGTAGSFEFDINENGSCTTGFAVTMSVTSGPDVGYHNSGCPLDGSIEPLQVGTTNMVENGSFESPALSDPFSTLSANDTSLTGWSIGGDSVDLIGPGLSGAVAADGAQFLDLSGAGAGSVSQTLPTIPGASYRISYAAAANPGASGSCPASDPRHLSVSWGGSTVDAQTPAVVGDWSTLPWTTHTVDVTATTASTTLGFASGDACDYGPLLDAVSVVLEGLPQVQQPQAITFGAISPVAYYPSEQLGLTGTATSNLPVSYSTVGSAPGACSATGSTLSITGVGLCAVTASQAGNSNYLPASPLRQTFTISPGVTSLGASQYTVYQALKGQSLNSLALTASVVTSGVPVAGIQVTFSVARMNFCAAITNSSGSATCVLNGARLRQLLQTGQYGAAFVGDANLLASSANRFLH